MRKVEFITLALCISIVFGCGPKRVSKGESDETLYKMAMEDLEAEDGGFPWIFSGTDYENILKTLKEIQLRYTYSPYATLAELRTADTYFKKEEYEQAAFEYGEFIKRHPNHEETPYAVYRLGLSYYQEMRGADRDPTYAREAVRWFDELIRNYPDSAYVDKAKKKRARAREELAEREIYIGKFYKRRENFKAAAGRFQVVVNEYSDTNKFEEALFLLGESYLEMDETKLARETLERVVEEFPGAEYSDDATELLSEIGKTEVGKKEKAKAEE
ncbi:MAG TPA: outer membrane protein assembly factor BamD [Thermodesulfobacteriota bacterium]|nr:outer membrane protein assembly factor BamD [Thermodesulfobacteriota bacterium]